jgi:ferrochelatase
MKRGALLMAYGAPNSLDEVEAFYMDIRGGRKPAPEQLQELIDRYKAIGGVSPLRDITIRQATALDKALGDDFKTYIGMRHWTPRIPEAIQQMTDDGIEEAVAIVMAPHYSRLSIGKYLEILDAAHTTRLYQCAGSARAGRCQEIRGQPAALPGGRVHRP